MPLEVVYRPVILDIAARPARDPAPRPNAVQNVEPFAAIEPRSRDFVARIRRSDMISARRTLHRPAHLRQRVAGIVLVALLPMVLAVLGWGDPRGIGGAAAQDRIAPIRIEAMLATGRPATPATANGLLTPAAAAAAWNQAVNFAPHGVLGAASQPRADLPGISHYAVTAPPLALAGTGIDRWRALECLTAAIYYEAAREPDDGQRAVAQVVLNRVAHPAFPKTVCGVVYQGSERPGCQFSFACDGSLAHRPMAVWWDRARRNAGIALAGNVFAPIGLATHYHTAAVHPAWSDSMALMGKIGAHLFYRWTGAAGQPRAFSAVYNGGEPIAAPHPHTWASTDADLADPLVLEKAFEAGRLAALRSAVPTANEDARSTAAFDPVTTSHAGQWPRAIAPGGAAADPHAGTRSETAPKSGDLRPEAESQYDGAAHWIHQPGT